MALKRVILGVGGGIAAYKSAELARSLVQRDYEVQAVMTRSATEFITPLTLASLTNKKVITSLFAARQDGAEVLSSAIEHINVALENDLLVVAPATADLIGKFANGLADDFMSTLFLAFKGPVLLAPAMNTNMWEHPAVQANIALLQERGVRFVGPAAGELACGMVGAGRLSEPEQIADSVDRISLESQGLAGKTILLTAGPTEEKIDPVRVITNRSSGKMGFALAQRAAERGAKVILVSGPVSLQTPTGVERIDVRSAAEMFKAVERQLPRCNVFIGVAAVADYTPVHTSDQKLKKAEAALMIELEPTVDILSRVGQSANGRIVIGFAAETEDLQNEAKRKLSVKNCDLIVGNLVGQAGTGFGSDENEVTLFRRDGTELALGRASKYELAGRILDEIARL